MSKIGRRSIKLSTANIDVKDTELTFKGPKGTLTHDLPDSLAVEIKDNVLSVIVIKNDSRKSNMNWGLHRALIANKVKGVEEGFSKTLKIVGLGYKAQISGSKIVFSLGYSHKIDFNLPKGIEAEADRSGQTLTLKSIDKFLLGSTCDSIKSLRPPEPYKGTGIRYEGEVIRRKAGKAKVAGG
ncbi:50S ribosomal protein L6 [Candidatus Babeliales bacterium]|nr:50S ribosomal protein L6 [Candidatus Babeliales bacterium]